MVFNWWQSCDGQQDWRNKFVLFLYPFVWVIYNFHFLKASCNYAFQTSNIWNTTRNYLIIFSLVMKEEYTSWTTESACLTCRRSLRITKMLQKQIRIFVVFMTTVSLLTIKPGFQCFVMIYHWEMNPDQDIHQTSIRML